MGRCVDGFLDALGSAPVPGFSPDALDPADLPVRFGRYELRSLLGEGGMGRVFEARLQGPEGFRKTLALKVVRAHVAEQGGVRDAIVSEARIGGLLSHPNLVDIYDFGIEGGQPWIAMEYVQGESLADRLRRGALRAADALDLLVALARGLAHLHGLRIDGKPAGLVHRDLKPGNVLLGADSRIKITDFGLARAMEGPEVATWSGAVRGTPAYMSPEQARGAPLDGRSDLFALGAIGFEAVSGERLLQGDGLIPLMSSLMRIEDRIADLSLVEAVVPGLAGVLHRCLRDAPEHRYGTVDEALAALLELRHRAPGPRVTQTLVAPSTVPASAPPLADLDGVFVGREHERADVVSLVGGGARLVTVVGAGGTGKTRLARRVAAEQAAAFPGGVYFADLTAASTEDGICHAVGLALQVGLDPNDPVGTLAGALHGRGRCLLLLDNFEQVAAYAGATVSRWLAEAPSVVILATSRAVLRVVGERVLRLGPLPIAAGVPRSADGSLDLPAAASVPAVQLFVARATEANPSFALDEDNVGDVLALVEALEGIPLAIELAAARARMLSPARILARLPRRFDLLTTGRADVTARQATLKATVDWSWDLLAPWEQSALAQLAVFRGGFALESAEEVLDLGAWPAAPWVMDVVQALADKSLIRVFEAPGLAGETRFAPYETIREYAADKLATPGAIAGPSGSASGPDALSQAELRHGRHFRSLPGAPRAAAAFGRWRRGQLLELDNLIAASSRAASRGDGETLLGAGRRALDTMLAVGPYAPAERYAAAWRDAAREPEGRVRFGIRLALVWVRLRRLDEATDLLARLVGEAEATGTPLLLADVLIAQSRTVLGTASAEVGLSAGRRALELAREAGDRQREGEALSAYGALLSSQSRASEARETMEEARRVLRSVGDHEGEIKVLVNLSITYKELGLDMLLVGTLEEALRRGREVQYDRAVVITLLNLGVRRQETGRLREALACYEEGLAMLRRSGDLLPAPMYLANIGDVHRELGELDRALETISEALGKGKEGLGERMLSGLLYTRADVLRDLGRLDEAESDLQEALTLTRQAGAVRFNLDVMRRLGAIATLRGEFDRAGQLLEQARRGTEDGRMGSAEARVFSESAELARRTGDLDVAEHYLDLAEEHARSSDDRIYQGILACRRALLERDRGNLDEARALVQTATHVAAELELPPGAELPRHIAEVRLTL